MDLLKLFASQNIQLNNRAWNFFQALFLMASLMIFASCNKEEPKNNISPEQMALVKKGKMVYMTYCMVCHNANPRLAGGIGPSNWGSSLELVTMKVLYGKYPKGRYQYYR